METLLFLVVNESDSDANTKSELMQKNTAALAQEKQKPKSLISENDGLLIHFGRKCVASHVLLCMFAKTSRNDQSKE